MKTVNMTFKIAECEITDFENWLRQHLEIIDLRIVPDTNKLYETDSAFRKLVKIEKKAREEKLKYINDNNTSNIK